MATKHLNLLLLSVVIVLAALLWRDHRAPLSDVAPLTSLDAAGVSRVHLSNRGLEDVELVLVEGAWRMRAPWSARADRERVERLLGILSEPTTTRYAVADVELAELGLQPPRATLAVDGLALDFGGASPLNQRRYVRVGEHVHMLEDRYFYQMKSRAGDYLDPRPLPAGAVIEELHLPGLTLRRGERGWRVDPPLDSSRHSADAPQVLIDAWQLASAVSVGPTPEFTQAGESIGIRLRDSDAVLRFRLHRDAGGFTLVAPEQGLGWRFSSSANGLLSLSEAAPDA